MGGKALKTRCLFKGIKKSVYALVGEGDGQCVHAFLASLDRAARRKVDVLFDLYGSMGCIRNTEKFKKLEGSQGIFEFKSFQVRLLCFMHGDGVVVVRGVYKKKDKHDKTDIAYAERCRRQFLEKVN